MNPATCLVLALLAADPTPGGGREAQYQKVADEFDAARAKCSEALAVAKTEAEEAAIRWPRPNDYAPRFEAMVEARGDDAAARKAILWLFAHHYDFGRYGKNYPTAGRFVDLLIQFHRDDESVGLTLLDMTDYSSPPRDRLHKAILDQTINRANRGRACLSLAQYLKMRAEEVEQLQSPAYREDDPTSGMKFYGAEYLASLSKLDPIALKAESERLFGRVLAEFADIDHLLSHRLRRVRTLGEMSAKDLDELRHLSVGKLAPEIEGRDIDDAVLKLSGSRGKVVVLVFWGSWCGACMRQVPRERALDERMRGRPFALLGVNSDEDRAKLREVVAREKIAGRSWFDGDKVGGPIATQWNVSSWPTVYVLDHRGVIRGKSIFEDGLDRLVDSLVAEAERDLATSGR